MLTGERTAGRQGDVITSREEVTTSSDDVGVGSGANFDFEDSAVVAGFEVVTGAEGKSSLAARKINGW